MDIDSINRQVKAFCLFLFPILNSVFHLNISDSVQSLVIGGLTAAIVASQVKTMADSKAKAAAAAIVTSADAAAVLGGSVAVAK